MILFLTKLVYLVLLKLLQLVRGQLGRKEFAKREVINASEPIREKLLVVSAAEIRIKMPSATHSTVQVSLVAISYQKSLVIDNTDYMQLIFVMFS